MPLAISLTTTITTDQYDEIWRQLRDAEADHPAGRLSHVGWEQEGVMRVVDVWDSLEHFESFGATLLRIIAGVGAEATPTIVDGEAARCGNAPDVLLRSRRPGPSAHASAEDS